MPFFFLFLWPSRNNTMLKLGVSELFGEFYALTPVDTSPYPSRS
jgi:hypothetical protein